MGLLKHFRSSSRIKEDRDKPNVHDRNGQFAHQPGTGHHLTPLGRDRISRLPPNVVRRIFELVCPHTLDRTYDACEDADIADDCCPLCDLRDLSCCAQTCRKWYQIAQELLYTSIRIDAVHYCALEEILALKRNRKSRHGDTEDVPQARLGLLAGSVRDNGWLASMVQFIKIPYMTRESARTQLTRCISACPNLRYVDLPEGLYNGDGSSHTLRQELLARCPDIRKMKYNSGAEHEFQFLNQRHWLHIEVLELSKLKIEPTTMRVVLGVLPTLHELKVTGMPTFTDELFHDSPAVRPFPTLQKLTVEGCHGLTASGLTHYLERPETREVLESLTLKRTGVSIPELPRVLWAATHLKNLTITATVTHSLPLDPIPPLASISLRIMHYDISPTEEYLHSDLIKPSDSYYSYLTTSLLSNSLPALRELYVRDPGLPDALLLAPPQPSFAGRRAHHRGFSQPLDIYTKGLDDTEWAFNPFAPHSDLSSPSSNGGLLSPTYGLGSPTGGGGRPISTYSTKASSQGWAGEARRSVVIGNGVGGFLAVPPENVPPRPSSAGSSQAWGVRPISYAKPDVHRPGSSHAIANAIKDEPKRASFWGGGGGGTSSGGGWKGHKKTDSSASRADLWR